MKLLLIKAALNAEVKYLMIGHFSSRYKTISFLVDEAREVFPDTFAAIDGKSYQVGKITEP
jgi:ribonuclease Z